MYLGVDGGGTKTAFVLVDEQGNVIAEHVEQTSYYIAVGVDGVRKVLLNGINAIFAKANKPIDSLLYAFFGLPAYGEDSVVIDELDAIPSALIPRHKYQCGNDMIPGWASALGCQNGINIVAGTGSIAYGENAEHQARCGGWGELFSDEGSAYWIARSGLNTFSRMSDGRLEKGPLYDIFKAHFNVSNDLDVCAIVMNKWEGARTKIAKLSMLVHQAAIAGDMIANNIFSEAAQELADIVDTTRVQLKFNENETIPVSYSGGVFNAGKLIIEKLDDCLSKRSKQYSLIAPKYTPVIGAALYAAKLDKKTFSAKNLSALEIQE